MTPRDRRLETRLGFRVDRHLLSDGKRLIVHVERATIKVEISPVLRGTVFPPEIRAVSAAVEDRRRFLDVSRWPAK